MRPSRVQTRSASRSRKRVMSRKDNQGTAISNHLPGNVTTGEWGEASIDALRPDHRKRRCARRLANMCTPCNRKHADSSMASQSSEPVPFSVVGIIVMIHGQEMSIGSLCPEKSGCALVGCLYKTVLSCRKEARTSVWCAVEHSTHRTFVRGDFILCRNHNIKIGTFRIFLRSFQKPARNP